MTDEESKIEDTVILLLQTERFKIDKKKLINKSQYFAVLLSTTYIDHLLLEHIINYDIPFTCFQNFINWINNDEHDKYDVQKICNKDYIECLLLLELSVLFAVDDLIENIILTLERYYLLPKDVIDIWLLAQELGLNVLQDLCLAVCLDRFTELPLHLIYKLSKQNFLKLVGNINLRIEKEKKEEFDLYQIAQEWMKINKDTIPLDILKKTGPIVYPSIISYDSFDCSDVNNEFYLHCWNDDKLIELTTFKYPKDIINNKTNSRIIGMQITARGHNLYLSGGEFGIGSGRFNLNVWRYSLISKKWFLETSMPHARRHMVATFVGNTLLLAGGVGQYRRKLRSLDIYNVHTGRWFKGSEMPVEFVTPPDYFVVENKLILCFSQANRPELLFLMYIYNSKSNLWKHPTRIPIKQGLYIHELCVTMMKFNAASCYIDDNMPDRINLRTIVVTCNDFEYNRKQFDEISANHSWGINKIDKYNNSNTYFYFTLSQDDLYDNNMLMFLKNFCIVISFSEKEHLQWHSIPIQNPNKFRSLISDSCSNFFHLMDPANLYAKSAAKLDCVT
ncbi:uncharacterized protein LOC126850913 [Cataglyphis hispanica]|uniref:uncharacterized protein LOC126850913 n=1 Tax=Cataglyphis hispanica TaxID=1086592 RepID=UPI00217F68FC|nr:uncharacterized protein LOC126850913 [Cataglyphis hispanica]